MSPPDGLTVRGFLADGHTGAGLGGLRVELWSSNGHGPHLIAASQSDDAGVVRFRLPAERLAGRQNRRIDVEWRVLDRGTLLLSEIRELPTSGRHETVDLTVPPFPTEGEEADEPEVPVQYEVVGQVKGSVPERAIVRAVLKTLRNQALEEEVVAEAVVNSTGWYRLVYERLSSLESSDTSLTVRLYTRTGEVIAESTPVLVRQRRMRVDVRPRRTEVGPSEYTLLEERIEEGLESGAAGLDGAEPEVVDEVSEWLDVDAERLAMLQEARTLAAETGIPAPVFYAFGRSGMGTELEDLLEVPIHELRTTLDEAIAGGIIDAAPLGEVESTVEQLANLIVEHALRPDAQSLYPGLGEVLATANAPPDAIRNVLRSYQQRSESPSEFWESFAETNESAEGVGDDAAHEMELAVRLSTVVGPDPPVLRHMQELRREGRWQTLDDLAGFSFDDWCELLEDVEVQEDAESEDTEDAEAQDLADQSEDAEEDDEAARRIEARAESILDTLEELYPSEFIRRRFADSEDVSPAARALLARAGRHDFHRESIRDRADADPSLIEGIDADEAEQAIAEVEKVERVSRVANRADDVAVLVGTGMDSAMAIGSMPRRQFISLYDEALGGRAQASRVHAQAQQTAAATKLTALRMLQSLQRMPFVLGAPPPAIKGVPDAGTLFQAAGGFCDCDDCGSVYSPAAYFVDLLRYLNVSSPDRLEQITARLQNKPTAPAVREKLSRFQPLDVLLGRRPDLADLPLTCENTKTPLPYIDLVNELLEAAITGGSAAFDTGKAPADVLRAVPQNISRDAYQRLQQAVHPITLPYHQPLALARAYLAHLGVSRLELMRVLGRGDRIRESLIAESLGMSPEEFAVVAQAPPELWRHFGYAAGDAPGMPFVQALAHMPTFLDATGIKFQSLIDLVSTRFLNADNQLQLETPSPDWLGRRHAAQLRLRGQRQEPLPLPRRGAGRRRAQAGARRARLEQQSHLRRRFDADAAHQECEVHAHRRPRSPLVRREPARGVEQQLRQQLRGRGLSGQAGNHV
jgi:hypothetical protein